MPTQRTRTGLLSLAASAVAALLAGPAAAAQPKTEITFAGRAAAGTFRPGSR